MDAKTKEAIDLLRTLIATPSPSRDESRTADLIFAYLAEHGAAPERLHNNVFARSAGFDPARPTLLPQGFDPKTGLPDIRFQLLYVLFQLRQFPLSAKQVAGIAEGSAGHGTSGA